MLGYDFVVEYKKGIENRAADAVSRWDQVEEETLMLISFPIVDWLEDSKATYIVYPKIQTLISLFKEHKLGFEYTMR